MRGRRPRAMNPAFAAAHGIQTNKGTETKINGPGGDRNSSSTSGSNHSLEIVLKRAQDTGKLVASNCSGLQLPLQDGLFEFPFGLSRYTEDQLTVVDFSDNEDQLGNSEVDERILKYRSVHSLRFRNCGVKLPQSLSFESLEHLTILDLSGNRLEGSLDVKFLLWSPDRVSPLVELNLSNNRIVEIVASSSATTDETCTVSLPNLKSLNVSHNPPLERLFDERNGAFLCENLRIFRCHHNPNLKSSSKDGVPSFLRSAKATLEVLEASHNPKMATTLDGVPCSMDLFDFEQLQTVNFALNKFENVPCIPHSVKTLDLRSNRLKSIQGIFSDSSPSQLVDLILTDNYLTDLDPTVVELMSKLQRLDLTSNKLRELPYQLGFLTELTSLNISGNPVMTKFSMKAANSNNPEPLLEILRKRAPVKKDGADGVSSSGIASASNRAASRLLTMALSNKGNATLDLAGKLTEAGGDALEGLVQELKGKASIDRGITGQILLDSNRLESVPEELLSSCLPNVQTISLTNNKLAELPNGLQAARSKTVKQLHLGKNLLTFTALERAFWFQPVVSSPLSISKSGWSLQSLTHLDLSSNKLTCFPIDTSSSVNCFPALEVLNLFNNKLSSLNDWKRLPESLAILDLSENNIEDIAPLSILLAGDCPQFQRLSLMHNSVRRIPASLGVLSEYTPNIVSLNVQGNPQRGIPSHVLGKSCGELLSYLSNRLTPDQRKATIEKIQAHKRGENEPSQPEHPNEQDRPVQTEAASVSASVATIPTSNVSKKVGSSLPFATEKPAPSAPAENSNINPSVDGFASQSSNDEKKEDEKKDEEEEEDEHKLLKELQQSVDKLKADLENLSLTQAKKYAVKKALAMERSKLIREERRLGLRK